jgi:DNA processing protein
MTSDAELGAAIELAGLPSMGPRRLVALLDTWVPSEALARAASGDAARLVRPDGASVLSGSPPEGHAEIVRLWQVAGARARPAEAAAAHQRAGIVVLLRDDARYPGALADDIEPPAVLFAMGDLSTLDGPRVSIVGTRRCTGVGAGIARELGRELAAQGVTIVSGLALGIDGAAHRGVLDAREAPSAGRPAGVVGSGLDVVYPSRHRDLWDQVCEVGLLLGEAPLGTRPSAWRFPARNRVIAALADCVVVVESHAAGGSLHTVTEAERRDIPVLAVPGSIRCRAAAGTNQLIADGCHPVRDAQDVLVALGLTPGGRRTTVDRRPPAGADGGLLLEALGWAPATLEHLAVRTGLDLGALAVAVEEAVASGWVTVQGGWYERVAAR